MTSAEDTVLAYWDACEARDWPRFGTLLADDVVYHLPQTRELIAGRDAYLRFNQEYPGDWHLRVTRVTGSGSHAASSATFNVGDEQQAALTFFDLDDAGRIARITEFWPEPYDPPPGREHLVTRYAPGEAPLD
ncbi:nuclear transport factor 2 family protein [Micromonospora sp. NPDC049366]|uniref:nuclear transport factor 2 family protein n=1 Tax=Micromonospora sp. NPDC049366 TaxID=3364271 RepID=UPI0037AAE33B